VLAILGLIAGTIVVSLHQRTKDAQLKVARIQVRDIVGRIEQFMINKLRCPTVDELVSDGYLRTPPRDAWGTPILVRCPGEHEHDPADVVSYGPDRLADTGDDVRSWEL